MVFYHVSPCPTAKAIVAGSDDRAKDVETYFSPHVPPSRADEPDTPRICVSPNVWQCLVPRIRQSESRFIYRLGFSGAIQAPSGERGVLDCRVTQEHWITEEVVAQNNGEIPLTCIGVITEASTKHSQLWRRLELLRESGVDPCSFDEIVHLWRLDAASPPEWHLILDLPTPTDEDLR
jgi:hypothetical protein